MSTVRFISDLHLRHEKAAEKRGFQDVHEHDEHLIECWNHVVRSRDTTYILGDVSMGRVGYPLLEYLNGTKHVVLGNHDEKRHTKVLLDHVHSVCGVLKYKGFWLTHIPVHPTELRDRKNVRGNIHGHLHTRCVDQYGYICVSIERIGFKPVDLDKILEIRDSSE